MNLTEVPVHTGFSLALMVTFTGNADPTDLVWAFDAAGLPVAHVAVEISLQVTMSPSRGI